MKKLCINCKFFIPFITSSGKPYPEYAECGVSDEINPITGDKRTIFCQTARSFGECGPDGNLFQSKIETK